MYKIALYTALASLDNTTSAYSSANEVVGAGYTAGGNIITPTTISIDIANNVGFVSFNNAIWTPASFTCRGALVYNSTTGAACFVLNFGSDKTCASSFTVAFPAATSSTAILRIT